MKTMLLLLGALVCAPLYASHAQSFAATPATDLATGFYLGQYEGGLYAGGSNDMDPGHSADGLAAVGRIASPMVALCIGMSNQDRECGKLVADWLKDASASPQRFNHSTLTIKNGATGEANTCMWSTAYGPVNGCKSPLGKANQYDRVLALLNQSGLTEAQVQVLMVQNADNFPTASLPSATADAYTLEAGLASMIRAAKVRYPNAQLAFLTSRIYAGYAAKTVANPEPYAYESFFAVKWLIQAQVTQIATGVIDPVAGDLSYSVAPWLGWGPYTWASGDIPRADGMVWCNGQAAPDPCNGAQDFIADRMHENTAGEEKVSLLWQQELSSSPFAAPWFTAPAVDPVDLRAKPKHTPWWKSLLRHLF